MVRRSRLRIGAIRTRLACSLTDALAQPAFAGWGQDATLLVFNAHHEDVDFTLPVFDSGMTWSRLIDTAIGESDDEPVIEDKSFVASSRSLQLFLLGSANG